MKTVYLFGTVALFFVPLFLNLDYQIIKICWGLGLLIFCLYSLKFVLGLLVLIGGALLIIPFFNEGNWLIVFIVMLIVCVSGFYLISKGVNEDFNT